MTIKHTFPEALCHGCEMWAMELPAKIVTLSASSEGLLISWPCAGCDGRPGWTTIPDSLARPVVDAGVAVHASARQYMQVRHGPMLG